MPVWINEFHYDDAGADAGEFIEVAGTAGTDLTGWTLVLYNGASSSLAPYATIVLAGVIPDQQNGFGTLSFAAVGLQNGSPDGFALVDPDGNVVEFLSYEGSFVAASGPAAGMTSVDVGFTEPGNVEGTSIGRIGTGTTAADFSWALISDDTPGTANAGQTFPGEEPTLSIADAEAAEGDAGATDIVFTVTRSGSAAGAVSAGWTVAFDSADATDFAGPLSGTVVFADGETEATVTVRIAGDGEFEGDETFTVTLSAPTGGAVLGDAEATGTIRNDDDAPPAGPVFINEIHYDNGGADVGEGVEIAGIAGTDLSGWSLVFYNGNGGGVYGTVALAGVIPDQDDGYGALAFAFAGIQNGAPDGVALVDADGTVVQFLSYEGEMVATAGPAAGMTSTDIGIAQSGAEAAGKSLHLAGTGGVYGDFAWESGDATFGAVNVGQDFIGVDADGLVTVGDAQVAEGAAGFSELVFTVRRAGGLNGSGSVDYTVNLDGTADSTDIAADTPLFGTLSFAPGETEKQIVVRVAGDLAGEANETLSVSLWNPSGAVAIVDGAATGTILNDDPIPLAVYEIQGEGHVSAVVGQVVLTSGIVTAVDTNGFYLQDAAGDGNSRTSDGIFVFTAGAPAVAVGDALDLTGTVGEFLPGGDPANLTVTQISDATWTVTSSGNALPAAVKIGAGGVLPPSETIDDDGLVYDPENDGIDFYESLEGMRVTIETPLVVSDSNNFGETFVVASGGAGATGVGERGGIAVSAGDFNPEKIQIDDDFGLFSGYSPSHSQGDRLGDVTGIVSYSFASYEVLITEAVTVTDDVTLGRETTTIDGDLDHLSIATYNVANLSPTDSPQKFDLLASDIVYSLSAPDIIAVQEMQDGNGLGGTDPLSAAYTAQLLIDAIEAAGGPTYVYVEIAPDAANSTGGAPGGNIRNGFFYNPDRVSLVEGGLTQIDDPAFANSRPPLVGTFAFNGEEVTVINVHFYSRGGSDPLFGADQPAEARGDDRRAAMGDAVAAYVNDALATDPALKLTIAGDFNGFYFEAPFASLHEDGVFTNLYELLPEEERYSYRFEGNLQGLDNIIVTGGLAAAARFDAVHINAEQLSGSARASDHDPLIATFYIPEPNKPPVAADDAIAVDEDAASGNLWSLLLANDSDPNVRDTLAIESVDGSGTYGSLVFDADTQTLRYVADDDAFDALAPGETAVDRFTYTVTDGKGLTSTATVEVTVTGIDDGIGLAGGNGRDVLPGTAGEDSLSGGNGDDYLLGLDGHDLLFGDNGADRLDGGTGNDVLDGGRGDDLLEGGVGRDVFVAGKSGGADTILDYEAGVDSIRLADGISLQASRASDVDGDGALDLVLAFGKGGGSMTLLGVASLDEVTFETHVLGAAGFAGPELLGVHYQLV